MSWTDNALLFSPTLNSLRGDAAFGLIDCGARNNILEPWASFEATQPKALRVLGFEADAAEADRLNQKFSTHRRTVAAAAWNAVGQHKLYLTTPPQASSLFPPNQNLGHLVTRTAQGFVSLPDSRVVARVVDVPTTTIDAALAESPMDADMLKIDTQGAEYEILEGATEALNTKLFAVTAETWTVEVYTGIRLMWDVMALMAQRGFVFMTQEIAGLARRSTPEARTTDFLQREQVISTEVLFFKDPKTFVKNAVTPAKVFKAIAIADVYGFADYGVDLLRHLVMRWPDQIGAVKTCYEALAASRAVGKGVKAAAYPSLNGTFLLPINTR